jgi:hypothetical protein
MVITSHFRKVNDLKRKKQISNIEKKRNSAGKNDNEGIRIQ